MATTEKQPQTNDETPVRDLELMESDVHELRKNFLLDLGGALFTAAPMVASTLPGIGFIELLRREQIEDPTKAVIAGTTCLIIFLAGVRISFGHLRLDEKIKRTWTSFRDYIPERIDLVREAYKQEGPKGAIKRIFR